MATSDLRDQLQAALGTQYTVQRELGRGGMATVYLAEDAKHHRSVALKVLHADLATNLGPERFRREIAFAAKLQHPHILTVLDSGETPSGQLWFTMPYIEGESLRDRLRRQHQLPLDDALRITREIALALDYAHRHNVIHRDIKPENILLVDGQAMIADFGIARALGSAAPPTGATLTGTGMAIGTPAYMSPEQAAGERSLDGATDVYALGAVLYEMLTGEPPFTGPTAQAIAAKMMAGDPPSVRQTRPTVPVGVDVAVRKALSPVPADRFATAALFANAVDTAERTAASPLAGAAVGAPPANVWRDRIPKGAAAVGLGVLVCAGGFFAWRAHERSLSAPAGVIRIAVLPFENLGATDDEYFADGMTEELTSRLAKLSGLAVIARTSAIQYKKTAKAIPQIGQELGTEYLIEGTVRWEKAPGGAGRVRITPQLIRAKDGTHVWADEYDKTYGPEIFDMQSDIAERVATALSVALLAPERKAVRAVPTKNLRAYDYFLRGQAYSLRGPNDWEAARLALESFQRAVQLDTEFALAYAWVAASHLEMLKSYDMSLPTGITVLQRLELARQSAERALALDPDLPKAHVVLAYYYYDQSGSARDTTRALGELGHALRGDPSDPDAVADRGQALFDLGRHTEGIRSLEQAATLDPRNPQRVTAVTDALATTGDYRIAEVYADRAIALAPDLATVHVYKVWLNVLQGRMDSARSAMREGVRQVGLGKLLFSVAQSSVTTRLFRIMDDEYGPAAKQLSWDTFGLDSSDYYSMKALTSYRKDRVRWRAYCDSLAAWAEPRVRRDSASSPFYHIIWAYALAGSGKREAAVREINRLLGDTRYVWLFPMHREIVAEACVVAALYDCAMGQLRLAMIDRTALTVPLLKVDPIWNPLRGRTDFQKLLEGT